MKKCKYCMSEIDESAILCPICRKNQNQKRNINKIIIILAILFIVLISLLFIRDKDNTIDNIDKIRINNR